MTGAKHQQEAKLSLG